jgi:hypothetical protein
MASGNVSTLFETNFKNLILRVKDLNINLEIILWLKFKSKDEKYV